MLSIPCLQRRFSLLVLKTYISYPAISPKFLKKILNCMFEHSLWRSISNKLHQQLQLLDIDPCITQPLASILLTIGMLSLFSHVKSMPNFPAPPASSLIPFYPIILIAPSMFPRDKDGLPEFIPYTKKNHSITQTKLIILKIFHFTGQRLNSCQVSMVHGHGGTVF